MAEVASRSVVMATYDDEDMTDEQMQELLAQAAARMQERNSLAFAQEEGHIQTTFPKLSADTVKPYVTTKGDVAAVDATRLLAEKDRKLSNRIRKVEDPGAVQKRLAEVRRHPLPLPYVLSMRKIFPNFFLERSSGTVLVAFPHY